MGIGLASPRKGVAEIVFRKYVQTYLCVYVCVRVFVCKDYFSDTTDKQLMCSIYYNIYIMR